MMTLRPLSVASGVFWGAFTLVAFGADDLKAGRHGRAQRDGRCGVFAAGHGTGFGGFLGVNEKFHPVPWSALDYVESENSYVVPFTKEQLKAAPADSLEKLTRGDGAASYSASANAYYKTH